jgi:hypothetical protein
MARSGLGEVRTETPAMQAPNGSGFAAPPGGSALAEFPLVSTDPAA